MKLSAFNSVSLISFVLLSTTACAQSNSADAIRTQLTQNNQSTPKVHKMTGQDAPGPRRAGGKWEAHAAGSARLALAARDERDSGPQRRAFLATVASEESKRNQTEPTFVWKT